MHWTLITGSLICTAILLLLVWQTRKAQQRADALETTLKTLRGSLDSASPETPAVLRNAEHPALRIDIHNALELAQRESAVARVAVGLAPAMIRQKVADTVAAELRTELGARGVNCTVEVIRG